MLTCIQTAGAATATAGARSSLLAAELYGWQATERITKTFTADAVAGALAWWLCRWWRQGEIRHYTREAKMQLPLISRSSRAHCRWKLLSFLETPPQQEALKRLKQTSRQLHTTHTFQQTQTLNKRARESERRVHIEGNEVGTDLDIGQVL